MSAIAIPSQPKGLPESKRSLSFERAATEPVPVDERLPNLFLFTMSMVRTNRAVSFELTNHFRVVDSALSGREPFRSYKSRCADVPLTRCVHRRILPTTGSGPLVLSPA